ALPVAVVDGYQHNFETDPEKVGTAIKQLQDQQTKDPTNADIPYYMAIAYEGMATRANRDGKAADADKNYAQALAVMESAVKAQDNVASFHYRAAQVYYGQLHVGMTDEKAKPFMDRVLAEIARANELVKPDDPEFVEIKMFQ